MGEGWQVEYYSAWRSRSPTSAELQAQLVNQVVSDETVMYGYESYATLTTYRLHYKLQTRPLVRKGAPRGRGKQLSWKRKDK
jgi:hypothetical protein